MAFNFAQLKENKCLFNSSFGIFQNRILPNVEAKSKQKN